MTAEEQRVEDNKVRAEIAHLNGLTSTLSAETARINREFQWYPFIMMTTAVAATATIVKVFFT